MSEGKGNWLVLQVTMGEEDPLHLISGDDHREVRVLGVEDGRIKLDIDGVTTAWVIPGERGSRARIDVDGVLSEVCIKSFWGGKAKVAIRAPEVLVLRHKLWLKDNAA